MEAFLYESQAARVKFGVDVRKEVRKELESLGGKRALVVSTLEQKDLAQEMAGYLGELCVGVLAEAVQHVPRETINKGMAVVRELQVDSLVPVGGGSSIGLAKALALETRFPILAIPTTYAGSEMTPIWGITENGQKKTGKNIIVKPKTVIYDPTLTVTLPPRLTVTSGMNAIAHCAEGLYAENANPIISMMAVEGITALSSSLPKILEQPEDLEARSKALYGTWLGGTVLGSVGMALHHKLCHVLGGSYNLQHADTHTVILPYAIWYNSTHAPYAMEASSKAIGSDADDVAGALFDLSKSLGVPVSLEEIGMKREDLDEAAMIATRNPYYNPRPIDESGIRSLLEFAFVGERPIQGKSL
ncbi:maleylacetate reductase [Mesobacillus maritimus]|uniref:Maleylacetate reductase n=1 Tax=Mesobacillus maritimus TaxID=1643336 RepID=A0ABS7K0B3_9BACI|nr:maleylacetate reductase [Mesobacillus maritimus]MBY0095691.1 maleylacetate reductase [Mesobacillus maritimus]